MNIHHLRHSLKQKWLAYYQENRDWLTILRIWGSYDGKRRPSSGYMLGILSVLEPSLSEWLPLIVNLNSNPDDIINSLGLNFNPEEQLHLLETDEKIAIPSTEEKIVLPSTNNGQFSQVDAIPLFKTTVTLPKLENPLTQFSFTRELAFVAEVLDNHVSQNHKSENRTSENGKSENGKSENNLSALVPNFSSLDETQEIESEIEIYNNQPESESQNFLEKKGQSIDIVKTPEIEDSPRQTSSNNHSASVTLRKIPTAKKELVVIGTRKRYSDREVDAPHSIHQTLTFMMQGCPTQLSTIVPLHTSSNANSKQVVKEKIRQPLSKVSSYQHLKPQLAKAFSVSATENNSQNQTTKNQTTKKTKKNNISQIPVIAATNAKNLPSLMDEFCDGK
jgi:hypothetical protein